MTRVRTFFILALCILSAGVALAQETSSFVLSSSAFKEGGTIPDRFTCKGADFSPPLTIAGIPDGTLSLALTVHDPDGVFGDWVHWVVFNIRPETQEIPERFVPGIEALNDFGNFYYGGPCPPDQKPHRYVFTLYALNYIPLDLDEGATRETLMRNIQGHIIAQTTLSAIYQKFNWE